MAFPVLESQERTRSAIGTSAAVVMPTGITAGDLLILVASIGVNETISINSGTNWIKAGQQNITGASSAVFWKIADGSDALILEWTSSSQLCAICSRISGAYTVEVDYNTGTTANPDPPNLIGQDGEEDYMYWLGLSTGSNIVPSSAPTDYSNLLTRPSSGGSYCSASAASRQVNTDAENPGAFTCAETPWVVWTCAVGSIEEVSGSILGTSSLIFSEEGVIGDGSKDLIAGETDFSFLGSGYGASKGKISGVSQTATRAIFTWEGIVDYTQSAAMTEWTDIVYGFKTYASGIYPSLAEGRWSVYWNEHELPNDHYAECSSHRWLGIEGDYIGIAVRMSPSSETYYGWYSDSAGSILFKVVAGAYTLLASGDSFFSYKDFPEEDDGERVRLEVVGNELRCYKNGALDTSINSTGIVTDSDISSGSYAGVCGYGVDALIQIDDFWVGYGSPMFEVIGELTEAVEGAIFGSSSLSFIVDGAITGDLPNGSVDGSSQIVITEAAIIRGHGLLTGVSDMTIALAGNMSSNTAIEGTSETEFICQGYLAANGKLLGSSQSEFISSAALHGTGIELIGVIETTFTCSGELTGTGKLEGVSEPAFANTIIDHTNTELTGISDSSLELAKSDLNVAYWRASHGSQLTEGGMAAIRNFSGPYYTKYAYQASTGAGLNIWEIAGNLQDDDDTFVATTRAYLDNPANSHINVVMWAWSGIIIQGATIEETISLSIARAEAYISNMETLISEYPNVKFVFMTSNTQVRDPDAWTARPDDRWNEAMWQANMVIREHCQDNNRYLYDFYDLECYDPSGTYFGDGNESDPFGTYAGQHRLDDDMSYSTTPADGNRSNYAQEWIAANPTHQKALMADSAICTECEHADGGDGAQDGRLTCIQKGIAAWALWANLADSSTVNSSEGELRGTGVLQSNTGVLIISVATLRGIGNVFSSLEMAIDLSGDIFDVNSDIRPINGSVIFVASCIGLLNGNAQIYSYSNLGILLTAVISGRSNVRGETHIICSSIAVLTASAQLISVIEVGFDILGVLYNAGNLSSNSWLRILPAADIKGSAKLNSECGYAFDLYAVLTLYGLKAISEITRNSSIITSQSEHSSLITRTSNYESNLI